MLHTKIINSYLRLQIIRTSNGLGKRVVQEVDNNSEQNFFEHVMDRRMHGRKDKHM
jgi:hypothetical protein